MNLLTSYSKYKSIFESSPSQLGQTNVGDLESKSKSKSLDIPMTFKDDLVYDLFKKWNGGKPLTIEQAKSMTGLPNIFSYKEIQTFDELKMFTSLTSIVGYTFWGCNDLESIEIPNSVTEIRGRAFANCRLKSINIPNSVMKIGENAFQYCDNLEKIILPKKFKRRKLDKLGIYTPKTKVIFSDNYVNESNNRLFESPPSQLGQRNVQDLEQQSIDALKQPRFLNIQLHQTWFKNVYTDATEKFSDDVIAILDEVAFDGLSYMFDDENRSEIFRRANDDNKKIKTGGFRNGFKEFIENYALYMAYDYEITLERFIKIWTSRTSGIISDYERDHPIGKTFEKVVEEINKHIKTPESSEFGTWASGWIQKHDGTSGLVYNFQEDIGKAISIYQEDMENYNENEN